MDNENKKSSTYAFKWSSYLLTVLVFMLITIGLHFYIDGSIYHWSFVILKGISLGTFLYFAEAYT